MKKTFFRTFLAFGAIAMMVSFSSCNREEKPDNNNENPNEESRIDLETPRSIVMGSDGNLYVTCYYPRCVAKFDVALKRVTAICKLGNYQPEGIAEVNGKLYIASGYIQDENYDFHYDNKLYVVDMSSFTLTDSITVGVNPAKVKKLDDSHIAYNTLGDYGNDQGGMWIMDVTSKQIDQLPVTLYNFDVYDGDIYGYTSIYSADPLEFHKIEGATHQSYTLGIAWTASDNPYGIGVNQYNGDIIITTDGGYTAAGDCYVYDREGATLMGGVNLGNMPSKIVALSNNQLLVLNEGGWGANNAGVSKVDVNAGTANNSFFDDANGRGLGDVAQDILIHDGKAYITVSFSNSIEILDIATGKSTRYATK